MLRANNIGFVFQNYSLIKHLRVWENIELPLLYAKKNMDRKQRQEVIRNLLKSVGLEDKENVCYKEETQKLSVINDNSNNKVKVRRLVRK